MEREAYKQLVKWKKSARRKPLVVQGARQVGKTFLISQFGLNEYENFAHLNFENNAHLRELFKGSLNPERLIIELSFVAGQLIEPGKTLVFFDEIQASEEALTSLKYFQEEAPEYHIIAAGSLLGVAVGKTRSFPVGKVNFLDLHPLSFQEFLLAVDEKMILKRIKGVSKIEPLPEIHHDKLLFNLKLYLFLGGMPEVVQEFIDTRNIETCRAIQKEILKAYTNDFSKYASKSQAIKNLEIWNSIPYQLAKEKKKFKYSDVKKKARAAHFEQTIDWLKQSGLVNIAYNISTPKLPLAGYADSTKFKIYLLDTGLLGAMLNLSPEIIVEPNRLFAEYNGAFIENFIAMELRNLKVENFFYWTSKGEAEVDFILEHKNKIYPVEVKSGTSRNLKSLRSYEAKYHPEYIFRTSPRNYVHANEFVNLPLYSFFSIFNIIDLLIEEN